MDPNWEDISYLKDGNVIQKKSYKILTEIRIFELLKEYNPILIGTIPIGIHTGTSDLDIACQVSDFEALKSLLYDQFGQWEGFRLSCEKEILVCNFFAEGMEIEVYASREESVLANGYRHMVIEAKLLELAGKGFREAVIALKENGMKTEPAFAKLLQLSGNPYEELLKLEGCSEEELLSMLNGK